MTLENRTGLLVAAPLNAPLTWIKKAGGLSANPSHPINAELLSTVTETSLLCLFLHCGTVKSTVRYTEIFFCWHQVPLPLKYHSIQKVLLFLFHVWTMSGQFISFCFIHAYAPLSLYSCLTLHHPVLCSFPSSYP